MGESYNGKKKNTLSSRFDYRQSHISICLWHWFRAAKVKWWRSLHAETRVPLWQQSAASAESGKIDRVVHLIDAVVVIKIEGDSFTNPVFASPVDDPSAPFSNTVDCEYLQAHIEKVLFDSAGLSESDTVNLFFGSVLYAGSLEALKTGERYLCFINKPDEDESKEVTVDIVKNMIPRSYAEMQKTIIETVLPEVSKNNKEGRR